MFDFAVLAKRRADEADRITPVALNFEMKGKRFAFDGYQISTSINNNQSNIASCMATNEITDGCGLSTEAVLPLNRKRRRVKNGHWNQFRHRISRYADSRSTTRRRRFSPRFYYSEFFLIKTQARSQFANPDSEYSGTRNINRKPPLRHFER